MVFIKQYQIYEYRDKTASSGFFLCYSLLFYVHTFYITSASALSMWPKAQILLAGQFYLQCNGKEIRTTLRKKKNRNGGMRMFMLVRTAIMMFIIMIFFVPNIRLGLNRPYIFSFFFFKQMYCLHKSLSIINLVSWKTNITPLLSKFEVLLITVIWGITHVCNTSDASELFQLISQHMHLSHKCLQSVPWTTGTKL